MKIRERCRCGGEMEIEAERPSESMKPLRVIFDEWIQGLRDEFRARHRLCEPTEVTVDTEGGVFR